MRCLQADHAPALDDAFRYAGDEFRCSCQRPPEVKPFHCHRPFGSAALLERADSSRRASDRAQLRGTAETRQEAA
jgi:hypothetical protein